MIQPSTPCSGCGLPASHCACLPPLASAASIRIVLLLHENEPARPSNTSRLIAHLLPDTLSVVWQRTLPPADLLALIATDEYQPWLLFPADRPELAARVQPFPDSQEGGKKPLVIVPDGTWKEVRKIVRKSPWLATLPLLALAPTTISRYRLRRNPDADHLCTAETVAEVLRQAGEIESADALDQQLDRFLQHYMAWQHHQPAPETR